MKMIVGFGGHRSYWFSFNNSEIATAITMVIRSIQ